MLLKVSMLLVSTKWRAFSLIICPWKFYCSRHAVRLISVDTG